MIIKKVRKRRFYRLFGGIYRHYGIFRILQLIYTKYKLILSKNQNSRMIINKVSKRRFYRHFGGIYRQMPANKTLCNILIIFEPIKSKNQPPSMINGQDLLFGGFTAISAGDNGKRYFFFKIGSINYVRSLHTKNQLSSSILSII